MGQVFGRTPDGKMGYLDDMTSERVDAGGVSNIAKLAQKLPKQPAESAQIIAMGSADDLKVTALLQHHMSFRSQQGPSASNDTVSWAHGAHARGTS